MRSVCVQAFSPAFDRVELIEAERPTPGPGQILVRMRYAHINPSDLNHVHGTYHAGFERLIWNVGEARIRDRPDAPSPFPEPPFVIGGEGVGVVEATGSGLLARRLGGQRVCVAVGPPRGTWSEYTVAEALKAVRLPASVPDEQAAMFFVNPLSAIAMVNRVLRVPAGATLLLSAAGSALGKSVVRLSRRQGFRVIALVRGAANREELLELGALAVIDTEREDLRARVAELTARRGVGYAMDCVGGELFPELVACLGVGAHMLVYGTLGGPSSTLFNRDLLLTGARVEGFFLTDWLARHSKLAALGLLREAKALIGAGVFAATVEGVYPLDELHAALTAASTPGRRGKVLLRLA